MDSTLYNKSFLSTYQKYVCAANPKGEQICLQGFQRCKPKGRHQSIPSEIAEEYASQFHLVLRAYQDVSGVEEKRPEEPNQEARNRSKYVCLQGQPSAHKTGWLYVRTDFGVECDQR